MIQSIFNRFERKFLINEEQKKHMIDFLQNHLIYDPYSQNQAYYKIYNIYYDTLDHFVIRDSLSKPKYKAKLRLRTYQLNPSSQQFIFLEIKKKMQQRISKRRLTLTYQQAMDYVHKGISPQLKDVIDQQIFKEIDYFIKSHQVKPSIYIEYERLAFMSQDDHLRITFDQQIKYNEKDLNFLNHSNISLFPNDQVSLMEIKSDKNFPLWLVKKLSEFELFSSSFSKYGKIYEKHIIGGYIDDSSLHNT